MIISRHIIHPDTVIQEPDGSTYTATDLIRLINQWHALFDDRGITGTIAVNEYQTYEHFALLICAAERGILTLTIPRVSLVADNRNDFDYVEMGVQHVFEGRWTSKRCEWQVTKIDMIDVFGYEEAVPTIVATPETPIIMTQTSGSTNKPKKFLHSHNGICKAITTAADLFFEKGDRVLLYSSTNHIGVLTTQILPVLLVGTTIYTHYNFNGEVLLNEILRKRPNKIKLFPQNVSEMQKSEMWKTVDLSFIDEVMSGGGALPVRFVKAMFEKGVKQVSSIYGLSEALPPMFVHPITPDDMEVWSPEFGVRMGKLRSDWQVKIVEDILWVKGSTLGFGLDIEPLKDEEGFYQTNDKVFLVNDEHWIKGRSERTIRRHDILVNVTRLQFFVLSMDGINAAVAHDRGEQIYLGIVPKPGFVHTVESINAALATELGAGYSIDKLFITESYHEADQIKFVPKFD